MTHNLEPLLLCPVARCGKTCEPPQAHGGGPAGDLKCPDCFEPMMLVAYAVLAPRATLTDMYRAVQMRGELRRAS